MADRSVPLERAAVLSYRAAAHDLGQPVATPADCGVLEVGVQDTPPGITARQALRARLRGSSGPHPGSDPSLALVHSLRGTMHVHRVADLPMLTAALRPDTAADLSPAAHGQFLAERADGLPVGDALDAVAAAMEEVMDDGRSRTKGELSTAVTPLVPTPLRTWCAGCGAPHVPDGLFRMATLPAALRLRLPPSGSPEFVRAPEPDAAEPDPARRELVRRFLRRSGPATPAALATWLGLTPAAARRWRDLLCGDLVDVRVDGRRSTMASDDLPAVREAPPATAVHLLPPYDPWTEVADRELLLPDPDRRRRVWRAAANPGVLLVDGEIAGTWRRRRGVVTVSPFEPLSADQRRLLEGAADRLAPPAAVVVEA